MRVVISAELVLNWTVTNSSEVNGYLFFFWQSIVSLLNREDQEKNLQCTLVSTFFGDSWEQK